MGGVDLWHNEDDNYDNFDPQSMHDRMLEVVSISGMWHLGKLQVISSLLHDFVDLQKSLSILYPKCMIGLWFLRN